MFKTSGLFRRLGVRLPSGVGKSFEVKVIALCLIAIMTALALAFAAFQWQDWHTERDDLTADELSLGVAIAPIAARASTARDHGAQFALATAMARGNEHTTGAVWFPVTGRPVMLLSTGSDDGMVDAVRPQWTDQPTAKRDANGVIVRIPYAVDGKLVGELVLRARADEITADFRRNSLIALGLALAATLLAGIVARDLTRRSLRPLYALERGIDAVRRTKDFTGSVEVISEDEFGRLTENFNALLTDLKTYDERLRLSHEHLSEARDAAEEANRQKSQFLAHMSHEIRTPLNGVLGMAQVMERDQLASVQRERLDVIRNSGATLLCLLDDILDLSKIEAGRLDLESIPFNLVRTVEEACSVFAPVAELKSLTLALDIDASAHGSWRGDAVRVRQLVSNLVSNALKFTTAGEIRVRIEATPDAHGQGLTLSVSDTGIGIPAEALSSLFQKFMQAESSTTRRFGGTGLGLAICRNMAELMGGSIEVMSEVGVGTTFTVRLPLPWLGAEAAAPEPKAVNRRGTPRDLSKVRVLAADDNATNRLVLKTVLGALGIEPTLVEDGRQAVEAWRAGAYDLVLMDIQMPVLDGARATAEIRDAERREVRARTRIVALSANAMPNQVAEYLAAGLDGHLAKPLNLDKLYEVVAEVAAAMPRRTKKHPGSQAPGAHASKAGTA